MIFDKQTGFYAFQQSGLTTSLHAHPALEIVVAIAGSFTLQTPEQDYENLTSVLIRANVHHAVVMDGNCEFALIEPEPAVIKTVLESLRSSDTATKVLVNPLQKVTGFSLTTLRTNLEAIVPVMDDRVATCLAYIYEHRAETTLPLAELAEQVHLSPSRLSHLFSQKMGLPIQKYLIWTRLKYAADLLLTESLSLTQAAHRTGFYDVAHFSKNYKEMLGVPPSSVHNSRSVQGFAQ